MLMNREDFERATGGQIPPDVKVVYNDGTPQQYGAPAQNGMPRQYGAPMQNGMPQQYGTPAQNGMPQQYGVPVQNGMPQQFMPNENDLAIGKRENLNGPHSKHFLISVIAGFAGVLFLRTFPYFAMVFVSMAVAAAAYFYRLDVEEYRRETKFTCGFISVLAVLMAAATCVGKFMPDHAKAIMCGAAAVVGAGIMAGPFISTKLKMRRCTEKVRAVCVGLIKKKGASASHHVPHYVYAPIWQYMIGGHAYTQTEEAYCSPPEFKEGDGADLMVNPVDPMDITRGKSVGHIAVTIMGLMVILMAILAMLGK